MAESSDVMEQAEETDSIVQTWINYRQELLLLYFACVGLNDLSLSSDTPNQRATLLCQSLMDYLSMGHFQVYEHLMAKYDNGYEENRPLIHSTFERIQSSTQTFVDFNDKYEMSQTELVVADFVEDLSMLGSELEGRFALEDALLSQLKG